MHDALNIDGASHKSRSRKYPVFNRLAHPHHSAEAWTALLEGALPPHLRDHRVTPPALTLSAAEVAQILLAAQYPEDSEVEGIDLLYHLGFVQDRWIAVVWLIKKLVDRYPARHGQSSRLTHVNELWQHKQLSRLQDLVSGPIELDPEEFSSLASGAVKAETLDEIAGTQASEKFSSAERLQHDALGQIWRTLGAMTKACAGGDIKPEVLEIIAYLHHREIMPVSIYQAEPHPDRSAVQQPPLIPFLSSRILTSLSDAAWRAHEKLVIEESKANGNHYDSVRPEIPGSVFRVHVAGLRPEVWMELILWSCLYGGWIKQGREILRTILVSNQKSELWSLLSWAEYEKQLPVDSRHESRDWLSWEYIFKTRRSSTMDDEAGPQRSVDKTISSEVVSAYVDAMLCTTNVGVGYRGVDIEELVQDLYDFRKALFKQNYFLTFGTWDAVVLRLVDYRSTAHSIDVGLVRDIANLSSSFGQGLYERNAETLPAYVLDGNSAVQGLLHRTLQSEIQSGSFEGALRIFKLIHDRVDGNKRKLIAEFFGTFPSPDSANQRRMFTSNVEGIEYPAAEMQIPPTILGPFLQKATEAKAFDFARWLFLPSCGGFVDAVIPPSMFNDRTMQPALIQFATESGNQELLAKFVRKDLARSSLRVILNAQIQRLQWDSAVDVLRHLATTPGDSWGSGAVVQLIRTMFLQRRLAMAGDTQAERHADRAEHILRDMFMRKFEQRRAVGMNRITKLQTILSVLSTVNEYWRNFGRELRLKRLCEYHLRTQHFNILLQGVVTAYGSAAGRRLVGIFWPHSARRSYDAPTRHWRSTERMSQHRPMVLDQISRQRIVIDRGRGPWDPEHVVYGALAPDITTIRVILIQAFIEAKSARKTPDAEFHTTEPFAPEQLAAIEETTTIDLSPRGMVNWAMRRVRELPYVDELFVKWLDTSLAAVGYEDEREELKSLRRTRPGDGEADVSYSESSEDLPFEPLER